MGYRYYTWQKRDWGDYIMQVCEFYNWVDMVDYLVWKNEKLRKEGRPPAGRASWSGRLVTAAKAMGSFPAVLEYRDGQWVPYEGEWRE